MDHPILFSAPMVRALLDGRKTQTRRILEPQPETLSRAVIVDKTRITENSPVAMFRWAGGNRQDVRLQHAIRDRLWVKEAHWAWGHWETLDELTKTGKPKRRFVRDWSRPVEFQEPMSVQSDKFDRNEGFHARLGRFIFRADSRLTLTVTDVRVQRLQDISEADAIAEGCTEGQVKDRISGVFEGWSARSDFHSLWDSINGPDAWDANPWVVATTFTTHPTNIDAQEQDHARND